MPDSFDNFLGLLLDHEDGFEADLIRRDSVQIRYTTDPLPFSAWVADEQSAAFTNPASSTVWSTRDGSLAKFLDGVIMEKFEKGIDCKKL